MKLATIMVMTGIVFGSDSTEVKGPICSYRAAIVETVKLSKCRQKFGTNLVVFQKADTVWKDSAWSEPCEKVQAFHLGNPFWGGSTLIPMNDFRAR